MIEKEQLQALYRYCVMLTRDTGQAEDLLQASLENWLTRGKHQGYSHAYMRRIVRNQFIDTCRRNKLVAFESLNDGTPILLDETSLEELQVQQDLIEVVIAHLNNADREVLYLWAVDGYSASEIAHELDVPRGTILSRLHRIKHKVAALGGITDVADRAL